MAEDANVSRGAPAMVASVLFTALAGIMVALRLLTRIFIVRNVGLEDWLVAFALACSVTLTALIADEVRLGMGHHFKTLPPAEFQASLKPFWASVPVYNLSLVIIKCSILVQYLRIFVGKAIRRTCYVLLFLVIVYGVWSTFGAIFMCHPVNFFWDKSIEGSCLNEMAFWFSNASINIVSDIAILVTPIPVLNSLQIPKRQKMGLVLVFAVGVFACVTSILRLDSLYIISVSTDITWDNVGAATWSSVEVNVGIMCACLPVLRPFFTRFFPRLLGATSLQTENAGTASGSYRLNRMGASVASASGRGFQIDEDNGTGFKNDVRIGIHRATEEGRIKVFRVFEVQHHNKDMSPDTSEINLIVDPSKS